MKNICNLVALEAVPIIGQGYFNYRIFRRTKKDSTSEILSPNDNLNEMKATRLQKLRSLRAWIKY